MLKRSALALFSLFLITTATAQSGTWTAWEALYSDSYITVEVQFYIPAVTACQSNGKDFKFKYRVKGRYRPAPYYLNWKMDYVECDGKTACRMNSLEIGKYASDDISNWRLVESMEYQFTGKSLKTKHYGNATDNQPLSGPCNKPTPPPVVQPPPPSNPVYVQPAPPPRLSNRYYDSPRKFFHYGFGIGLEWMKVPAILIGSNGSIEFRNIHGIGLPVEAICHPFMKENFSLGLYTGASLGTTPHIFNSGEITEDDGSTSKEHYFYYRWNIGGEAALGFRRFKLLYTINRSAHKINYDLTKNYGTNNPVLYELEGTNHSQTTGLGIRIGRYLKTYGGGGNTFDLLYTFTDDPEDQFLDFSLSGLGSRRHGLSLMWWSMSQFKAKFDISMGEPGVSVFDSDWSGTSFQLSIAYNLSRFY